MVWLHITKAIEEDQKNKSKLLVTRKYLCIKNELLPVFSATKAACCCCGLETLFLKGLVLSGNVKAK